MKKRKKILKGSTETQSLFTDGAAADLGSDFVDTVHLQNGVIMDVL